jgi:hypothetical protein
MPLRFAQWVFSGLPNRVDFPVLGSLREAVNQKTASPARPPPSEFLSGPLISFEAGLRIVGHSHPTAVIPAKAGCQLALLYGFPP